nr:F-box/kelch-repeat protein At3g23880-like [Ipomoea trifida]
MEVVVHIPIEIIRCVLLKLGVKTVIRCKCICKEWRSIIQDPHFKLSYRGRRRVAAATCGYGNYRLAFTSITNALGIKTLFLNHIQAHSKPHGFPNQWRVLSDEGYWWSGVWCCCNGLVLFSVLQHILLWNPSTRCCTKVLELQELLHSGENHNVVSGLCYVPSTGDYKAVVCLLSDTTTVLVASLKNKEWRKVLFPYEEEFIRDGGVNFRNTPHWRVGDCWEHDRIEE